MYRKKSKAVSFAESIIALVIVAVVAGFTIPTVIQNLQMAHYRNLWKNFYKDFNNIHTKVILNNRGTGLNLFTSHGTIVALYGNHLNYIRKCSSASDLGCWHLASEWYNLDGTTRDYTYGYGFLLTNGALVGMRSETADCTYNVIGTPICGSIYIDVDGFKGPNTIGKDIYVVWIQERILRPAGSNDIYIDTCAGTRGFGCSALYLKQ